MKYKVIIRFEAENDLKEVFLWYEDKRLGLGYDFLLQVDIYSTSSRLFLKPKTGEIAVKVINHYGDEVMKM